jgi:L-rhamnose isomerase
VLISVSITAVLLKLGSQPVLKSTSKVAVLLKLGLQHCPHTVSDSITAALRDNNAVLISVSITAVLLSWDSNTVLILSE